jgi:hypothetical protein
LVERAVVPLKNATESVELGVAARHPFPPDLISVGERITYPHQEGNRGLLLGGGREPGFPPPPEMVLWAPFFP